jgi:transposase
MDLLQDPPDLNHPSNSPNGLFLEQIRHSKYTSRDQRRDIQLLHREGFTIAQIAEKQACITRQVQYAITHPATPRKRPRRPQKMTEEELQYLIEWICASKENRRCRWDLIPQKANLIHLSYYAIQYALHKAGFFQRTARCKPPISEQNRQKRLQFALEHLNWTSEQ